MALPEPEPEPLPEPDEPAEPAEPAEPDAPLEPALPEEPDAPDAPEEPDEELPDAPPASLPELEPLPEHPFCFHWASVGDICRQSAAPVFLLLFVACEVDEGVEAVSLAAIVVLWWALDVLSFELLFFDFDFEVELSRSLLPVDDEAPLPYVELPLVPDFAVPLPSPAPPPVLPKVVPLEPVLFGPLALVDGVPEELMPAELPVVPLVLPIELPVEPVVEPLAEPLP